MSGSGATDAVWTTADYALVVSLCSAFLALVSLGWNIWSKFIFPKPKLRTKLKVAYPVNAVGELGSEAVELSVTNHGPGTVEIVRDTGTISGFSNRRQRIIVPGYIDWPMSSKVAAVAGTTTLPTRLEQGSAYSVYIPSEPLVINRVTRVGFVDSFDREKLSATRGLGLSVRTEN